MSADTRPATGRDRLGPVDQIPIGEGRAFGVDGEQVAVFRLRSGAVHAVSAVCPHKGGPIADGQIDGSHRAVPAAHERVRTVHRLLDHRPDRCASWQVEVDEPARSSCHSR